MGYIVHIGEMKSTYKMLVGKCQGKKQIKKYFPEFKTILHGIPQ